MDHHYNPDAYGVCALCGARIAGAPSLLWDVTDQLSVHVVCATEAAEANRRLPAYQRWQSLRKLWTLVRHDAKLAAEVKQVGTLGLVVAAKGKAAPAEQLAFFDERVENLRETLRRAGISCA